MLYVIFKRLFNVWQIYSVVHSLFGTFYLLLFMKKDVKAMDIQYSAIGKRIQLRRKELGLRQCVLAEILNISNNHMSSIETGREKPSLEILLHICDALKVTPDYLLLGNMHADDISQDILESLRLCSREDIALIRSMIELFVERIQGNWNQKHSI